MRSAIIIVIGIVSLGAFVAVGWRLGGTQAAAVAAKVFIAAWFVAALANMWMGVAHAGYSIAEELPIFLALFGIPAAVAALIWWKMA